MKTSRLSYDRRKFLSTNLIIGGLGSLGLGGFFSSCTGKNGRREKYEDLVLPAEQAPDGIPLKAGLIGCGHRGTAAAIDFINAGNDLSIVAAADVFQDRIDAFRKHMKDSKGITLDDDRCFVGLDAYKRLLECDVDVVLQVTQPYFRPGHLKACVEAGKHVFIEKPAAVDPVGARSVMASSRQAESRGLCIVSGTQRRHSFDYMSVLNLVQQGIIGKITGIQTYWLQGARGDREPVPQKETITMEEMIRNGYSWNWVSGDQILSATIHWIDVANWFMGKVPVSAFGLGGRVMPGRGDGYNVTTVDFVYEGEVHQNSYSRNGLNASWSSFITIRGTEGYTNARNTIWNTEGEVIYEYPYKSEAEKAGMVMQAGPNQYQQEHVDLVTAIRTGNQIVEAEELARSTLTCIMGRESACLAGEIVTWDQMMSSEQRLGPDEVRWGPVDFDTSVVIPDMSNRRI